MNTRRPVDLTEIEAQILVRALACLSLVKGDRFVLEKIADRFEGGAAGYMRQRHGLLREILPGFAGHLDEGLCNADLRGHVDALRGFPDEEFGGIILPIPVIVGDPDSDGQVTLEIREIGGTHQLGPVMLHHGVMRKELQFRPTHNAQLWLCFPKLSKEHRLGYVNDALCRDGYLRIVGFIDFASLPKDVSCTIPIPETR